MPNFYSSNKQTVKSESKLTGDSLEPNVDPNLVTSKLRNMFSFMKNAESGDSNENSKEKRTPKAEPQIYRPVPTPPQRTPSLSGFRMMIEDSDVRGISDPKLQNPFMSGLTRYAPNESDPHGFNKGFMQYEPPRNIFASRDARNMSNNSNISQSYMFHNFQAPDSFKQEPNVSKPTEFNFDMLNMGPTCTNNVANMWKSQMEKSTGQEREQKGAGVLKDGAMQSQHKVNISLSIQPGGMQKTSTQRYTNPTDIQLVAPKRSKIVLEIMENGDIQVTQNCDLNEIVVGTFDSKARNPLPIPDSLKSKIDVLIIDNKFNNFVNKLGSSDR